MNAVVFFSVKASLTEHKRMTYSDKDSDGIGQHTKIICMCSVFANKSYLI